MTQSGISGISGVSGSASEGVASDFAACKHLDFADAMAAS